MKQHPVDLLPASVRAQSQAGVRTGQSITAIALAVVVVVVAATHVRWRLESLRDRNTVMRERADAALDNERRVLATRDVVRRLEADLERYRAVALPIEVSRLMAGVVAGLPEHVTLDRFDVEAGLRTARRSPRSRGGEEAVEHPRVLTIELSGFAGSDAEVATLVADLDATEPFYDVNLDFSRTRLVRGMQAREFRVSMSVDLDASYEIVEPAEMWSRADVP